MYLALAGPSRVEQYSQNVGLSIQFALADANLVACLSTSKKDADDATAFGHVIANEENFNSVMSECDLSFPNNWHDALVLYSDLLQYAENGA